MIHHKFFGLEHISYDLYSARSVMDFTNAVENGDIHRPSH